MRQTRDIHNVLDFCACFRVMILDAELLSDLVTDDAFVAFPVITEYLLQTGQRPESVHQSV